jgi:hypothetical protein
VDIDPSAFAVFDDLAARAQVAYLVEMDHCIAEKSAFRLSCIRYLASHGWRWFGEEVDPRIAARLDAGVYEPLRDDPWYTRGILAATAGSAQSLELDVLMQRDRARLVQDVRRDVPDARWFGFDVGHDDKDYLEAANAADTYEQLADVMALRERRIHERVDAFRRDHPNEKFALMAGSIHLATIRS